MTENKKIYFAADIHLGAPTLTNNDKRERLFVAWLEDIRKDAVALYLLGDIFDYWFEYKKVVPKGFIRTFGKLAELSDNGIDIHFFAGNHDQWSFGYLEKEVGLTFHLNEHITTISGKKFFLHHGDGLGKYERKYNFLKKIFRNKTLRCLYKRIHPDCATSLAHKWSSYSRISKRGFVSHSFLGVDKEHQILYAKKLLEKEHFDYFIFGHRHLPFDIKIGKKTRVISLGDWISHFKYVVFDGDFLTFKPYRSSG